MTTIQILCVNDFHAELRETESTPGCAKFVAAVRHYLAEHPNTAVLFGGDNYRGDPISEYSGGRPVTELMKTLGTTASALGNHEFDFPTETLARWQAEGEYRYLAANLLDTETGEPPAFTRPYVMVELSGIRIAVIGLATREPLDTAGHPADIRKLNITDGVAAARYWTEYLQRGGDPRGTPHAIIALTHFGLKYEADGTVSGEEMLALCRSGVKLDGAFSAHWHQFMALELDGIPVAQGGSRGQGFAVLTLTFDENRNLVSVAPSYINIVPEIAALTPDPRMEAVYNTAYETAMTKLGEVLGYAPQALRHRDPRTNEAPYAGSELSGLALQAMIRYTGRKIALFYSGWLGDGLRQGPVTRYDLCRLLRFNGGMVPMKVTGAALLKNLSTGIRNLRGESLSPLAVAGLRLRIAPDRPQGQRLLHVELEDGSPISPDAVYEIVIDSSMAENAMGFDFSQAVDRSYPEASIRTCMEQEIRRCGTLSLSKPVNIEII